MLDGTGSGTVIVPAALRVNNDSNFRLDVSSSNPLLVFDSGDFYHYNRSTDIYSWFIGNVAKLTLDSNGKLGGAGFYESSITSVGAGSSQGFTHGLGAQPRIVMVWYGSAGAGNQQNIATPATLSVGSTVRWSAADSTTILVTNNTASSQSVRVVAIL